MHFKELTPRLNFLKDSAGSLSSGSPSTAAYLMMVHNGIFQEESRSLNQHQQEKFCGACGNPRKPEWTKTTTIQRQKQNKKQTSTVGAKPVAGDGAVVYKCLRCRRRTVTPARKETLRPIIASKLTAPAASINDLQPASSQRLALSDNITDPSKANKAAENASSKKRAKARKQGGLQALLASKQSRASASQSLDLFDFLQQ